MRESLPGEASWKALSNYDPESPQVRVNRRTEYLADPLGEALGSPLIHSTRAVRRAAACAKSRFSAASLSRG